MASRWCDSWGTMSAHGESLDFSLLDYFFGAMNNFFAAKVWELCVCLCVCACARARVSSPIIIHDAHNFWVELLFCLTVSQGSIYHAWLIPYT